MAMLKQILLLAFLLVWAAPAFAAGPEVVDSTKEPEAVVKAEDEPVGGTLKIACTPWAGGQSIGIELDNHVGATVYVPLDIIPENLNKGFRAGGEQRKPGESVIYHCNADDTKCEQFSGYVKFTSAKNPVYTGVIQVALEGAAPMKFKIGRVPSTAKCDDGAEKPAEEKPAKKKAPEEKPAASNPAAEKPAEKPPEPKSEPKSEPKPAPEKPAEQKSAPSIPAE
jgi:hypothetical protein